NGFHNTSFKFPVSGFEFPLTRSPSRDGWFGPQPAIQHTRDLKPETRTSYSIDIFLSSLKSLSIFPVPSTPLHSGSADIDPGSPVSSRIRLSRFFSNAPPPVSTIPRSLMSAES